MAYGRFWPEQCRKGMLDGAGAGLERKVGLFKRSDIAVPVGAARDGNS